MRVELGGVHPRRILTNGTNLTGITGITGMAWRLAGHDSVVMHLHWGTAIPSLGRELLQRAERDRITH